MTSAAARVVIAALAISPAAICSGQLSTPAGDAIAYHVDAEIAKASPSRLIVTVTARNTSRETVVTQIPDCAVNVLIHRNDATRKVLWNSMRHNRSGTDFRLRQCDPGILEVSLPPGDSIRGGPLAYEAFVFHIISDSVPAGDYPVEVTLDVSGRHRSFDAGLLNINSILNVGDAQPEENQRTVRSPIDSSLAGIELKVKSGLERMAPTSFAIHISAHNKGRTVAYLEFGACALTVFAYRSPQRAGTPVWRSDRIPQPFAKNIFRVCPAYLATKVLEPGQSFSPREFNSLTPTYEILGDSLNEGLYYFRAELELSGKAFSLNTDSVLLLRKQSPVPSMRTFHGISYSASARRIASIGQADDSIEFTVRIRNTSNDVRTIEGRRDCITIDGYESSDQRDYWYMRPWLPDHWRSCSLYLPLISLRPGEVVSLRNTVLAPLPRLHYSIWMSLINSGSGNPGEGESFSISADEGS
jgi:hypothetical protein